MNFLKTSFWHNLIKDIIVPITIPLVIVLMGIIINSSITESEIERTKAIAESDRTVKLLEIFTDALLSDEDIKKDRTLNYLNEMNPTLALKFASLVLGDTTFQGERSKRTASYLLINHLGFILKDFSNSITDYRYNALNKIVTMYSFKRYRNEIADSLIATIELPEDNMQAFYKNITVCHAFKLIRRLRLVWYGTKEQKQKVEKLKETKHYYPGSNVDSTLAIFRLQEEGRMYPN
jgi:hypothetical protein